jgi:hypothetical protein
VAQYIEGDKALVELAGTTCSGSKCQTLTAAMQVRPGPGLTFAQAWTKAADENNATDAYQRVGNFWYLETGLDVPASVQEPVPSGACTQVPAPLHHDAGTPSKVAGKTTASVADTLVTYASQELSPDAQYYRLQNVTVPEGVSLLDPTVQIAAAQATQATTALLMTPGAPDDSLTVFRFDDPAQAAAVVRMFWVVDCAELGHAEVFDGAVIAPMAERSSGVTNFSTDVVVAVGPYAIVYRVPGQLPYSMTQPMVTQIVGSLESPSVSPKVDIPATIGPVAT